MVTDVRITFSGNETARLKTNFEKPLFVIIQLNFLHSAFSFFS